MRVHVRRSVRWDDCGMSADGFNGAVRSIRLCLLQERLESREIFSQQLTRAVCVRLCSADHDRSRHASHGAIHSEGRAAQFRERSAAMAAAARQGGTE